MAEFVIWRLAMAMRPSKSRPPIPGNAYQADVVYILCARFLPVHGLKGLKGCSVFSPRSYLRRITLAVVEKEEYRIEQCRQRLAAAGHAAEEFCWEVSLEAGSDHHIIPG